MILDQKISFTLDLPLDEVAGFVCGHLRIEVFPAAVRISLVDRGDHCFFHAEQYYVPSGREDKAPGAGEARDLQDALQRATVSLREHLAAIEKVALRVNGLALQAIQAKVENL